MMMMFRSTACLLLVASFWACAINAGVTADGDGDGGYKYEAPEPFPYLHDHCSTCNPPHSASPDPLVRTTWSSTTNTRELQIYRLYHPINHSVIPPNSITGLHHLLSPNSINTDVTRNQDERPDDPTTATIIIHKTATLLLDWGVEVAGWLEFVSPNLAANSNVTVHAALSEFNVPYPGKTREVTQHGASTFRLETNSELYEGVRFTWLYFDFLDDTTLGDDGEEEKASIHISNISLVAKVKPVSYSGSFESSENAFNKIWYSGAYAVRLNMEADGFNSVLVDRGDRVAIQGDGHPTMAASLVAFAPYRMIHKVLQETNSGHAHGHHVVDESIMAYPIYWTLSVHDWYMASGEKENFIALLPDIRSIVDLRIADFLSPDLDITWMGWDDRLGNGWCFHGNNDQCPREAHLTFAALVIRACNDLARSLELTGMISESDLYEEKAQQLTLKFRQVSEYPGGLGVHSAANAINAGLATQLEIAEWMKSLLNDAVTICSWSPFNQYWILQAFGNAGQMEHALASIRLCWEPMAELGHGCFWELFSPEWPDLFNSGDMMPTMPSYCHPWSSGVTAWMSHMLGGIKPLLPGYEEFVAVPYVSVKYPTVFAEVPTPKGVIAVNASLTLQKGEPTGVVTIRLESKVPGYIGFSNSINGYNGTLRDVFSDGVRAVTIFVDEISAHVGAASARALGGHFSISKATGLSFVRIETGGSFDIRVRYNAEPLSTEKVPHLPPFPEPQYKADVLLDRKSKGDGIYEHGSDGFILFGHFENGTDLLALPNYVESVTVSQHGFRGWKTINATYLGSSKDNPSYLPNPRDHSEARKIGVIGKGIDMTIGEGLMIDIALKDRNMRESVLLDIGKIDEVGNDSQSFVLSLYCQAADRGEDYAIRVMDLSTKNVIAPTTKIYNYGGGVWWSLQYNGSVRLRLMSVHGLHISAVAFESTKRGLEKASHR